MIGHNRIDERMDEKVSRDLMTGLMGEEAGGSWRKLERRGKLC